jgi:hypothetical protein
MKNFKLIYFKQSAKKFFLLYNVCFRQQNYLKHHKLILKYFDLIMLIKYIY